MLIPYIAIVIRPEEMKHLFKLAKPLALLYVDSLAERAGAIKALCAQDDSGSNPGVPFVGIDVNDAKPAANHTYHCESNTGLHSGQIGTLFFTSGTSGNPKGVVHSYNALLASARERMETWKLNANDVVLNQKPGNWMGGIFGILPSLMSGACL
jgi:acyl-coenzyme A synthetase/AMP-(fatty) acid ligase